MWEVRIFIQNNVDVVTGLFIINYKKLQMIMYEGNRFYWFYYGP